MGVLKPNQLQSKTRATQANFEQLESLLKETIMQYNALLAEFRDMQDQLENAVFYYAPDEPTGD